ncbi:MAG: SDR family NAD(P)-dependent oxidoreductase [Deltaproteobacteria bacterium]|nr:SDR family NAD(P)-dependent oxidoreductase [Deltaproteobacteria bacterium]
MDIAGKVAIVTGGASGLGKATAERLIASGAKVAVFDLDDERGRAFAEAHPESATYEAVNVSDEGSAAAGVERALRAFGAVHVCVNCAGVGGAGRTVSKKGPLPLAEFSRTIHVNLIGTFNVMRLVAAEMIKNEPAPPSGERGVIVNTASIAAFEGQMGQAAYAASKAGVVGLTLPVARDLAAFGIRVCTIAPGLFETPMIAGIPAPVKEQLVAQLEFPKRAGDPVEYAALVAHLIENAYLNGEVIRLDGGTRPPPR